MQPYSYIIERLFPVDPHADVIKRKWTEEAPVNKFLKFRSQEEASRRNSNLVTRSVSRSDEANLVIERIRLEFHKTLDLNCPFAESSSASPQFPFKQEFINVDREIEARNSTKETKKRSFPDEKNPIPDLNLKPSSPAQNQVGGVSTSSSQCSKNKMALKMKAIEIPKNPTLVVMGCHHCFIYVMVSDMDPHCPKCNAPNLINAFCKKPSKRPRCY